MSNQAPRMLPVPDGVVGERVDSGLARMLGVSRTQAAGWAESGLVELNGVVVGKSAILTANSWLEVAPEPVVASSRVDDSVPVPGLRIIFEDDHVLVVDKPVGVAVHPSPGWDGPTVVAGLAALGHRLSTSGPAERQGVVHRLDVGTSGVMVLAKSESAYSSLKHAFKERTVEKIYHALVQGLPDPVVGTIDAPIGRHPHAQFKMAVVQGGKPSITHYELLEAFAGASLLEVHLETGRTHQIRVHCAALRHPCVGDLMYGADPVLAAKVGLERQWLHAVRLAFHHPFTGEWVEFESPYSADLAAALEHIAQRHRR